MKMLQHKIDENYKIFCEKNTIERENATSVKNTIMATLSGAAAIAGAAGSYFIAGPSGVRLFLTAVASAVGGGGAGAAINTILPANWTNSESVVGRTIRFVTSNLNELLNFWHPRDRAIANDSRRSNTTSTSENATNTGDDPLSRVWNGAKSTVFSAINSILHFKFRRN